VLDALVMTAALALPNADNRDWMRPSRSAPSSSVQFLQCVIRHESARSGGPNAENRRSSASGLFQFLDSTFQHYARHVPSARKYKHASHAPASVQWEVALLAVKWHGVGNWKGTHCGRGT
jgi:hypothetical protein